MMPQGMGKKKSPFLQFFFHKSIYLYSYSLFINKNVFGTHLQLGIMRQKNRKMAGSREGHSRWWVRELPLPDLTCLQILNVWQAVKFSENSHQNRIWSGCWSIVIGRKRFVMLSGGQKRKLRLAIGLLGGSKGIWFNIWGLNMANFSISGCSRRWTHFEGRPSQ